MWTFSTKLWAEIDPNGRTKPYQLELINGQSKRRTPVGENYSHGLDEKSFEG